MSTIIASSGETIQLVLNVEDGADGLYPRAYIFDDSNNLIDTVDLEYVVDGGFYAAPYVVPGSSKYTAIYVVYGDDLHTQDLSASGNRGRAIDLIVSNATSSQSGETVTAYGVDPLLFP